MKILTQYTAKNRPVDFEILDETRLTDGSQYKSISECIQIVARGEAADLHDYTKDNPFDRIDPMDIADHAEEIINRGKEVEQKYKQKPIEEKTSENETSENETS